MYIYINVYIKRLRTISSEPFLLCLLIIFLFCFLAINALYSEQLKFMETFRCISYFYKNFNKF